MTLDDLNNRFAPYLLMANGFGKQVLKGMLVTILFHRKQVARPNRMFRYSQKVSAIVEKIMEDKILFNFRRNIRYA
ncbi:MAG: hypothetical protein P4L53_08650 [Candidatus Obscuribacterales bacterium]|nr:hypothetical protein [Candidatus Obscuribacterales bacterium]